MLLKKTFLSIVFIFLFFNSNAQTATIDSLKIKLQDVELKDKERLKCYFKLTELLSNIKPDEALSYNDSAYNLAEELELEFEKAEALNNKAGILLFQGQFTVADSLLDLALHNKDTGWKWITLEARAYTNKGNIRFFTGSYDSALTYYDRSIQLARKIADSSALDKALNNKSAILLTIGKYQLALIGFQEAMNISEAIRDTSMLMQQFGNIATIYMHNEQIELAKQYSFKAIDLSKEFKNYYVESAALTNLGVIYIDEGKLDSARFYSEKSLELKEEMKFVRATAISILNIGRIEFLEGKLKAAEKNYSTAFQMFKEQNLTEGIAAAKVGLANVYLLTNRKNEGEKMLKESLELGMNNELGADVKNFLFETSRTYAKIGNYIKAYNYLLDYKILSDSLFANNTRESLNELKTIYESEKQKNEILNLKRKDEVNLLEIDRQNAMMERDRATIFGLSGGAVLLSLLVGLTFLNYQRKKKDHQLISEQKAIVEDQKALVDEQNKEIIDSITYAKRIQKAILPPERIVKQYLEDSFILYKPKDIIAGDFYWMEQLNGKVFFAACDCTGHGVPGAMVSVVCNNGLNRSVREMGITEPAKILDHCRNLVLEEFGKSDEEVNDGMDIALCAIKDKKLEYAGAHNPLWIIRNDSIIEVKADKQPIGKFDIAKPFTNHKIDLLEGDTLYVFSDGFADQFGGENGKKIKSSNFKKLLLSIQDKNMEEQSKALDDFFEKWKGNLEQLDDVCIIGLRV